MKSAQDFTVIVDKLGTRVPYKEGEPMPINHRKITVSKGEDVPEEILNDILQFNRDYLDMSTLPPKMEIPKSKPLIEPRKHSMESLTILINQDKKKAVDIMQNILKEEFQYHSTSKRNNYLRNKILELQESKRRGA